MTRKRLLCVDDEPDIREFIADVAEDAGYDVRHTGNPQEFFKICGEFSPHIVVMDLQMPEADGIELLRLLAERHSEAKILLVSGVDTRVLDSARRVGEDLGLFMLGWVQKPISLAHLEDLLGKDSGDVFEITEESMLEGIRNREFKVYYQPKIARINGGGWRIQGCEALIRWVHPTEGVILPAQFLPQAEGLPLMADLTETVLDQAITQLAEWHRDGLDLQLAVNLSPAMFNSLLLPDEIGTILKNHGIPGDQLILEVTESTAMADVSTAMDILTRFRLKSFGLSIDDFGTGYSSLTQLYRMPFNELKIDQSFIQNLSTDKESQIIVRSIVELAQNLELTVCVEGVETEEVLLMIEALGCEKAQGFFISPPVPAEEFTKLARVWSYGEKVKCELVSGQSD